MPPSALVVDAMLTTSAAKAMSGTAENVAVAVWPTAILMMSTSLTCTVTFMRVRSAICTRCCEPSPPPWPTGEPDTAFMAMRLPAAGAVTVRCSAAATAWA